MNHRTLLLVLALAPALAGCSGEEPGENAFQAQTEALDKTRGAVEQMEAAAEAQRKAIDEQGR